jgi:hypothetical protein
LPISVGHLLDRRISRAVFKHTQPSLFFVNYFLYLFYLLLFKLVSKKEKEKEKEKEKDAVVFFLNGAQYDVAIFLLLFSLLIHEKPCGMSHNDP